MKLTPLTLSALALSLVAGTAFADTPAYHLAQKISLPGDDGWDYMTLDSTSRHLYLSRGTHVSVLNADTGAVIGDIPNTKGVHGIALDPKSGHGFTSDGRANAVTIFDLKTLKTLKTVSVVKVASDTGPDCVLFDPATERVFTFNGSAGTATAINAATGKVVGTIRLPGRPEFAVADGRGHLYNNIEDKNEVAVINARTLKVERLWPVAPGKGPSGIALDPKSRRLFSVCDNGKMAVMDADTGKVVSVPVIGNGPDACAFDAKNHLVFSPNGEDGTMTVLRESTPNHYVTVATVPTQVGARTMAFDAKTGAFFTAAATLLPAAPGTPFWKQRHVPGSFVVLKYVP